MKKLTIMALAAMLSASAFAQDVFKQISKIKDYNEAYNLLKSNLGNMSAEEKAKCYNKLVDLAYDKISKEQGTREMKELLGEDFLDVFQTNPIPISIEVQLKADYFSADSIEVFRKQLAGISEVDEVLYENSVIETINTNIERIGFIVSVFILLLLFISFVLINNTVRLNVYSKRFSIYTMRLVGATKAFIRAPFLVRAVFQGLISGLFASCVLVALLYVIKEQFAQLFAIFDMGLLVAVLAGTVLLGVLICVVCTFFVMNRLVSLSNDELYY